MHRLPELVQVRTFVCHIYERFEDSAAAMTHLESFGANFAARFMGVVKPTRLVFFATPSAKVKDAFAGMNPIYMTPFGALEDNYIIQFDAPKMAFLA